MKKGYFYVAKVVILFLLQIKASLEGSIWYPFETKEYLVEQTTLVNYTQATSLCLNQGANLVRPQSHKVNEFLVNLNILRHGSWIGVIWNGKDYVWRDGSSLSTSFFGVNGTYRASKTTSNCVLASKAMKWYVRRCQFIRGYICERPNNNNISGSMEVYFGKVKVKQVQDRVITFDVCQNPIPTSVRVNVTSQGFTFVSNVTSIHSWGFSLETVRLFTAEPTAAWGRISWKAEFLKISTSTTAPENLKVTTPEKVLHESKTKNFPPIVTTPLFAKRAAVLCRSTTIYDKKYNKSYTFDTIKAGLTATSHEICSSGRPEASVDCVMSETSPFDGYFASPLYVVPCNLSASKLNLDVQSSNATTAEISAAVATLKLVTSSKSLSIGVVANATLALFLISNNSNNHQITPNTLYDALLTTLHLTLPLSNETIQAAQFNRQLLQQSLQNFADKVVLPNETTSLVFKAGGSTIQVNQTTKSRENTYDPVAFSSDNGSSQVSALIPGSLLDQASREMNTSAVQVSFVYHMNSVLFPSNQNTTEVISVSIKGFSPAFLSAPLKISFQGTNVKQGEQKFTNGTLKSLVTRTQCSVYQSSTHQWIPNGCNLIERSFPPLCSCNTLASFSMIISQRVLPSQFEMMVVSYIGLSLSVLALFLTLCIYIGVKELLIRQPTAFLINICINLLLSDLIFLFGVSQTQNHHVCYLITALLQYFLLVSWFMMTANAYNMYKALTKVAYIGDTSIVFSLLVCYLVPLAITIINSTVAIYQDGKTFHPGDIFFESSYRSRQMCWLRFLSLYYGFLLPVGILGFLNIVFFLVIIYKITCNKHTVASTMQDRSKADDVAIAFAVLTMMGLTWVFGYLMLVSDNIAYLSVMSWLFTVLNAFQGFLIFFFNCLRKENVRKLWLHPCISFVSCRRNRITGGNRDTLPSNSTTQTTKA